MRRFDQDHRPDQRGGPGLAWQARLLEALYPVILAGCDRGPGSVTGPTSGKAAHIAVGAGYGGPSCTCLKHLGPQAPRGMPEFWAGVCAELANRGIKDVLIVCRAD